MKRRVLLIVEAGQKGVVKFLEISVCAVLVVDIDPSDVISDALKLYAVGKQAVPR